VIIFVTDHRTIFVTYLYTHWSLISLHTLVKKIWGSKIVVCNFETQNFHPGSAPRLNVLSKTNKSQFGFSIKLRQNKKVTR